MKKFGTLICILFDIFAIGIIALNIFVLNMPLWIGGILCALLLGSMLSLWLTEPKRKVRNILFTCLQIFTAFLVFAGSYCNPYWNSLNFRSNADFCSKDFEETFSYQEAVQDLDYAMRYLKKVHPALKNGVPQDLTLQYEQALENLKNCDKITVNVLCREIECIFSKLGDAHTFATGNFREYHYMKDIYPHKESGHTLTAINGISLDELFQNNSELFSFEVPGYGMAQMRNKLTSLEDLNYLGIQTENGVTYTYVTETGEYIKNTYFTEDFLLYEDYVKQNHLDEDTEEEEYHFVKYEIQPEHDLAILTLDSCNYNEEYRNCLKEMFTKVKEQGIRNVCVDLRDNGGGNSLVADEFLHYLDINSYFGWGQDWRLGYFLISSKGAEINNKRYENLIFDGNVYVLTSTYSFSSAMDFAMLISDNHLGTLIGEAPGNSPRSYGDISMFQLPNSKIYMQISTKQWHRIDEDCTDLLVEPDIKCNSDEALEELYRILEDNL